MLRVVFVLRSTEILPVFLDLSVSASAVALFEAKPGKPLFFHSGKAVLSKARKAPSFQLEWGLARHGAVRSTGAASTTKT